MKKKLISIITRVIFIILFASSVYMQPVNIHTVNDSIQIEDTMRPLCIGPVVDILILK